VHESVECGAAVGVAILHAGKDIENRSWRHQYATGTIAIHASSRSTCADSSPSKMRFDLGLDQCRRGQPISPVDRRAVPGSRLRSVRVAEQINIRFFPTEHWLIGMGHDRATSVQSAIGDAIFQITGKRVRDLPYSRHDLSWS
jgi:hypothetical protein